MCLILFAYRQHPRYKLLLAANRDEFYARPTAPMHFWDDSPDLLAGRDLEAGGTWLGATRRGRLAAITNYRNPSEIRPNAPSRGHLVSAFLQREESAWDYLQRLAPQASQYNGFNLLLMDPEGLFYFSNQNGEPQALQPGFYGLSNHLLNTPWPKVQRGCQELQGILEQEQFSKDELLQLLADPTPAPDETLPDTGVSLKWERRLSSMFIESPDYGTRSSTLVGVEYTGRVWLTEKNWSDGIVRDFEMRW